MEEDKKKQDERSEEILEKQRRERWLPSYG